MYSLSEKKGNKETMSAFARTRKRAREGDDSMSPSPKSSLLWEVIVKWDDICFKHVLPRLNGTDRVLYGVNTETRKLIKRSSRASDLKEEFRVSEMSSISTLEFAWEHKSLWSGWLKDETISARKLLKRINSSYSSGYERRKSASGMNGRLKRPHVKVIWKW